MPPLSSGDEHPGLDPLAKPVLGQHLEGGHADLVAKHGVGGAGGGGRGEDVGAERPHVLDGELVFEQVRERGPGHAVGVSRHGPNRWMEQTTIDVVDGRSQQPLEERRREFAVRELDRIVPRDRLERLGGAGRCGEHVGHDRPGRVAHALERLRGLGPQPAILVHEKADENRERLRGP